jgi:hypothetical protein
VLQLAGATDPGVKRLTLVVLSVMTMRLEHIPAAVGQHRRTLTAVDGDEPN